MPPSFTAHAFHSAAPFADVSTFHWIQIGVLCTCLSFPKDSIQENFDCSLLSSLICVTNSGPRYLSDSQAFRWRIATVSESPLFGSFFKQEFTVQVVGGQRQEFTVQVVGGQRCCEDRSKSFPPTIRGGMEHHGPQRCYKNRPLSAHWACAGLHAGLINNLGQLRAAGIPCVVRQAHGMDLKNKTLSAHGLGAKQNRSRLQAPDMQSFICSSLYALLKVSTMNMMTITILIIIIRIGRIHHN